MNSIAMNGGLQYPMDYMPCNELVPLNTLSGSLSNFNLIERLNKNEEAEMNMQAYFQRVSHNEGYATNDETESKEESFTHFKIGTLNKVLIVKICIGFHISFKLAKFHLNLVF